MPPTYKCSSSSKLPKHRKKAGDTDDQAEFDPPPSHVGGLRLDHAVLSAVGLVVFPVRREGQLVADEETLEGVAKLLAHDAVQDEVDGAVGQHQDVHQIAQVHVHVVPEGLVHGRHPGHDALGDLGDDEADDHADQHHGGAVVLAGLVVVVHDA